MVRLNGLPLTFWCSAQGMVFLLRNVWGRSEEPSEVPLEGSQLVNFSELDIISVAFELPAWVE